MTGKKEEKSNNAVGYIGHMFQCSLFVFGKEVYKSSHFVKAFSIPKIFH